MSWMAKLYDTYEAGLKLDLSGDNMLMPISHTLQNAHINIVLDGSGNFIRANVLKKQQIFLPSTEKSAGRSSGEAPHPLADKIQYVAKDYPDYGGRKKSYFPSYEKLLREWCNSVHSHPKAVAIYEYIKKGTVIKDLIDAKIFYVNQENRLMAYWPDDAATSAPEIFSVLPAIPKNKRVNKDKPEIEQGDALVCWTVENPGDPSGATWQDKSLQQSWISFYATVTGGSDFCYVLGRESPASVNHPAKLRHTGDKAKLISANDLSGFTFRGRFTDSKKNIAKNGLQPVVISFEVTQKAHNALRWLISRQGYRNDSQVYVAWAVSGKKIPDPLKSSWDMLSEEIAFQKDANQEPKQQVDHSIDLGSSFAHHFKKYLAGYHTVLNPTEQIVVMGLDSATPGRMSIIYYREFLADEFLKRVELWHSQFAWPQLHTIEINEDTGKKKRKGTKRKTIWPESSPSPRSIIETVYGDIVKTNDKLKKSTIERIIPCIVDGRAFPRDLMETAVRRTCNRMIKRLPDKYSNFYSEQAKWKKQLGVACALFKGYYQRHPDTIQRRTYSMALEEDRTTRDYLYGRLLAIAEYIEETALRLAGEERPTTAARLMQRFADRPFSSWRNLELSLQPYEQRLKGKRAGFLVNRQKELDLVSDLFAPDDYTDDSPLTGEFLLGYHCQRQFWKENKTEKDNHNMEANHESE